jgi:hypothetical protein
MQNTWKKIVSNLNNTILHSVHLANPIDLLLPNQFDHGVCCHRPLLEPKDLQAYAFLLVIAAMVETTAAMASETEAVARRQWKQ